MTDLNFIALDCEWVNNNKDVCEIGITKVTKGNIIYSRKWLILPQTNDTKLLDSDKCKISEYDIYDAPTFAEVWDDIVSHIENNVIICHNAKSADMDCLVKMLCKYNINNIPNFIFLCSCRFAESAGFLGRSSLSTLCSEYGISQSNHHEAMDDTISCAKVFIECYKEIGIPFNDIVNNQGESFKDYYDKRIYEIQPTDCTYVNIPDINSSCCYNLFEDFKFCLTGKTFKYGKFLTNRLIHKLGGKILQDVRKKNLPDIVIYSNGYENSGKVQRARQSNIQHIISEDKLFEYISTNKVPIIKNDNNDLFSLL